MPDLILFSTDRPDFYVLEQIYDSVTNPTGTIIPRPQSLVLDVSNGVLKRVLSVNETTLNSTYGHVFTSILSPPTTDDPLADDAAAGISIIDYGNSRMYLFYDKAETPTKLTIDKKVMILGNDAYSYEIDKFDAALQRYIPISLYFDTEGTFNGTKIPLNVISDAGNAKVPSNCHTTENLVDGNIYHMFIFDYAGTQCGSISLFARKAVINNVLDDTLLIEAFTVEATQMDNDGFYLFPDQDPSSLLITPRVVLNNGKRAAVNIDNSVCYLYGLEGFTAAYPGQTVDLLVKYFLAPTQQAVGDDLVVSGSSRYMIKEVKLTVKDPGTNEYSFKILTVPIYLPSVFRWTLVFFLYSIDDNVVHNVTSFVNVSPAFDGRLMGINQELMLSLRVRELFPDAATDYIYQQPVSVKLAPYDFYERYVIRDTAGDSYGVFGVDSPILPRPVIYYDETLSQYFIPSSKFSLASMMLEAFYYKARPLYDSSWLSSPLEPTHFTLRNAVTGNLMLSAPIAMDAFQQAFAINDTEAPNKLLGTNCIVEFLKYELGEYTVLYGSPVDVYRGTFA